jgi:hypothetical protein
MYLSFLRSRAGTWELLSIAPIGRRRVDEIGQTSDMKTEEAEPKLTVNSDEL